MGTLRKGGAKRDPYIKFVSYYTDEVWRVDVDTGVGVAQPPLPGERSFGGIGRLADGNVVLACGSLYGGSFVELYDPANGQWTVLPPVVGGRDMPGCCVLSDGMTLAIVGGVNGEQEEVSTCLKLLIKDDLVAGDFQPQPHAWEEMPPMRTPRVRPVCEAVGGGCVVVVGGNHRSVEVFDERMNRWHSLPLGSYPDGLGIDFCGSTLMERRHAEDLGGPGLGGDQGGPGEGGDLDDGGASAAAGGGSSSV